MILVQDQGYKYIPTYLAQLLIPQNSVKVMELDWGWVVENISDSFTLVDS